MPAVLRVAVFAALLLPASLSGQRSTSHQLQPASQSARSIQFHEMVSLSGSLEFVLSGVPALTDTQRDSIEQIEQELRDSIFRVATPMRRAQGASNAWWAAENVIFERELNAIVIARAAAADRLRGLLTPAQQPTFERNLQRLRDWDIGFWQRYVRGATGTMAFDTVPVP